MQNEVKKIKDENVVAGSVGAFLFALVGGVIWFVLYQVGFLAGISGLIAVIAAVKGYTVFSKKESLKGVIISVIMAIIVMIIAWYLCLSTDVYNAYQEWYKNGEVDFTVTFFEAVRGAYVYLMEPEIGPSYFGDLAIGLGLCAIGAASHISTTVKRLKAEAAAAQNKAAEVEAVENSNENAEPTLNGEVVETVQETTAE